MIRFAAAVLTVAVAAVGTRQSLGAYTPTAFAGDSLNVPSLLDGFESLNGWKTTPSDGVSLTIAQDAGVHGKAMRLDFDFRGHGGYAVVHRDLPVTLPTKDTAATNSEIIVRALPASITLRY